MLVVNELEMIPTACTIPPIITTVRCWNFLSKANATKLLIKPIPQAKEPINAVNKKYATDQRHEIACCPCH